MAKIISTSEFRSQVEGKDKWYYFTSPTPGKVNDTISFEELGGWYGSIKSFSTWI